MNTANVMERVTVLRAGTRLRRQTVVLTQNTGARVQSLLHALVALGYLSSWKRAPSPQPDGRGAPITVTLRYRPDGTPALKGRARGPSVLRGPRRASERWGSPTGYGAFTRLLTTSQGVMTDSEARKKGLGGLPLLRVT